jgi:hypothetical protein
VDGYFHQSKVGCSKGLFGFLTGTTTKGEDGIGLILLGITMGDSKVGSGTGKNGIIGMAGVVTSTGFVTMDETTPNSMGVFIVEEGDGILGVALGI